MSARNRRTPVGLGGARVGDGVLLGRCIGESRSKRRGSDALRDGARTGKSIDSCVKMLEKES